MKKLSFYFVAVLSTILFILNSAIAQEVSLKSGDLTFLKNNMEINVEYDYSNMGITKRELGKLIQKRNLLKKKLLNIMLLILLKEKNGENAGIMQKNQLISANLNWV